MSQQLDISLLSKFQPLHSLNPDNLKDVQKQVRLEKIEKGKTLFKKGDVKNEQIYLVKGEIELLGQSGPLKTIKSGSPEALNAIAHILPRTVTAQTRTDVILFRLDGNMIDVMLTWDQTGSYQITEFGIESGGGGDDDWMSHILQTEAFHRIPPANIQAIFMRMETVPVKAGEVVIKQGDDGDYFYIIKKGRSLVTRTMPNQPKGIKLAELKDGDTFGEEALISSSKRNASVTMLTDGVLSRLSKNDFTELLKEPILDWVSFEEGQNLVNEQNAVWLDVRLPAEHQADAIKDDTHIPLIFLRMKMNGLDESRPVIVYCDTGRRSSAASYLLNEKGFTTYILKDGIGSVPVENRTGSS